MTEMPSRRRWSIELCIRWCEHRELQQVLKPLGARPRFVALHGGDETEAFKAAKSLKEALQDGVVTAYDREGRAIAAARWDHTPLSDLAFIDADILAQKLMVAFPAPEMAASEKPAPKRSLQKQCEEWIREEFAANNRPPNKLTKGQLFKEAKVKFPGLSGAKCLLAWKAAAPEEARKPGRKRNDPK